MTRRRWLDPGHEADVLHSYFNQHDRGAGPPAPSVVTLRNGRLAADERVDRADVAIAVDGRSCYAVGSAG